MYPLYFIRFLVNLITHLNSSSDLSMFQLYLFIKIYDRRLFSFILNLFMINITVMFMVYRPVFRFLRYILEM